MWVVTRPVRRQEAFCPPFRDSLAGGCGVRRSLFLLVAGRLDRFGVPRQLDLARFRVGVGEFGSAVGGTRIRWTPSARLRARPRTYAGAETDRTTASFPPANLGSS